MAKLGDDLTHHGNVFESILLSEKVVKGNIADPHDEVNMPGIYRSSPN